MDPDAPFALAEIVVVPADSRVAIPVVEPMLATPVFDEVHVGFTAEPLFVALNVTEPVERLAVNVPEPWEIQPEQEMVKLPPPLVLTVSVVTPLMLP